MIAGSHIVIYTQDADADRTFFRDVLHMPAVDAGGGWLIFALPPAEVAFHPADRNDVHEFYLMCDDLAATIRALESQGIHNDEPSEQGWGITTQIQLPGGGKIGLYQPKHPTAFSGGQSLMNSIRAFVEIGEKKVFAGAVDWPGWCRSGRDEKTALQALIDYGPRYAQVLQGGGIEFQAPTDASALMVIERHNGNATTDFGTPAIILDVDREPMARLEFERVQRLLLACWQEFDCAVQRATGRVLRKGPRGGGRDLDKIVDHVLEADRAYLGRLARKHKREAGEEPVAALRRTRQAIGKALEVAVQGDLPERGPRGGIIWPARYFVRRVAWHVLDHAWEIEDRIV